MQANKTITLAELYQKGWTVAAAARRLGRSTTHVNLVVNGKRQSASVVDALLSLPHRSLELRERVNPRNRRRPATVA